MTSRRRKAAERRRKKKHGTGSPPIGEPAFLLVGRLGRPHGIRGEILMKVMTDFPERIQPGEIFFLGADHIPVTVTGIRHHNKGLLIGLDGFNSREAVAELSNKDLFVSVDDRPPLPDGEFYMHELIGMHVISDEGQSLGILAEIIETGANNVFVVRGEDGTEVLLPNTEEVVLEIDVGSKRMRVHLIEGLI